jgi:hypothetical protein
MGSKQRANEYRSDTKLELDSKAALGLGSWVFFLGGLE